MTVIEKTCTKCAVTKPLEFFNKTANGRYGRNSRCIECEKANNRERYAKKSANNRENRVPAKAKACVECGITKHPREFHSHSGMLDGLSYYCKDCANSHTAKWRSGNLDRLREMTASWRAREPEKQRAAGRAWSKNNRDRANANVNAYRARKLLATVIEFSVQSLAERWQYYGNKCWVCRDVATETDHVKPISRGGSHMLCNLRPICRPCNASKNNHWPLDDWLRNRLALPAAA